MNTNLIYVFEYVDNSTILLSKFRRFQSVQYIAHIAVRCEIGLISYIIRYITVAIIPKLRNAVSYEPNSGK